MPAECSPAATELPSSAQPRPALRLLPPPATRREDGSSMGASRPANAAAVPPPPFLLLLCLAAFLSRVEADRRAVTTVAPPPVLGRVGHAALRDDAEGRLQRLRLLKCAPPRLTKAEALAAAATAAAPPPSTTGKRRRVFHVTEYGADPSGRNDSGEAISRALADAFGSALPGRTLLAGIPDLGGVEVHLDGGSYLVSRPIRLPSSAGGNIKIHGGSLVAAAGFPADGYLIELWSSAARATSTTGGADDGGPSAGIHYEYITLRDLMLDCGYRGGGIAVVDSLRTTIDNCYIVHFTSDGVLVRGGHETFVRSSYLGQHITAGGDPGERNFGGVGINLQGNDNAVTDVVIFSAATGVVVAGEANTLVGVHCYNKAAGWGGIGVHVRLPGLSQTRVLNSYLDYTGIVAEDPVQLLVAGCFFLGDARVVLKAVKGVIQGVSVVDNQFAGGGGAAIVELDQTAAKFTEVDQLVVERNSVKGMVRRETAARGVAGGNGTVWEVDFAGVLLLPDRIDHVDYTMRLEEGFTRHALRSVAGNKVVVEAQEPVAATVHVAVRQGTSSSSAAAAG